MRLDALPQASTFNLVNHRAQHITQLEVIGTELLQVLELLLLPELSLAVVFVHRIGWNSLLGIVCSTPANTARQQVAIDGRQAACWRRGWRWRRGRNWSKALVPPNALVLDASNVYTYSALHLWLVDDDVRLGRRDHGHARFRMGIPRRRRRRRWRKRRRRRNIEDIEQRWRRRRRWWKRWRERVGRDKASVDKCESWVSFKCLSNGRACRWVGRACTRVDGSEPAPDSQPRCILDPRVTNSVE